MGPKPLFPVTKGVTCAYLQVRRMGVSPDQHENLKNKVALHCIAVRCGAHCCSCSVPLQRSLKLEQPETSTIEMEWFMPSAFCLSIDNVLPHSVLKWNPATRNGDSRATAESIRSPRNRIVNARVLHTFFLVSHSIDSRNCLEGRCNESDDLTAQPVEVMEESSSISGLVFA
jgi:hypothetical protein